jgi:hypothetical protein
MAMSICSKAVANRSIVLMARIVDGEGVAIRPLDVRAIECSVYEVDPYCPEQLTAVRGHRAVRLAARDVLFDSPRIGRSWSVDEVGYNFRHEIRLVRKPLLPRTELGYEIAYELTMIGGRRSTMRFSLRCNCVP